MPTDINQSTEALGNSPYALQRLLLQLQTSETMVYTTELTQSFGWTNDLIYVHQQDVQELERLLMEKLEDKELKDGRAMSSRDVHGKDEDHHLLHQRRLSSSRTEEELWDLALNIEKGPEYIWTRASKNMPVRDHGRR